MSFNWNLFPWTKFNELNLDWFLGQFKRTQDAMEDAESAVKTINTYDDRIASAERNSTIAVQQAGEALATAGDAKDVAEGIEGKADNAILTAQNAVDTANAATTRSYEALDVAHNIDAKATQAIDTANAASTQAASASSAASGATQIAESAEATANGIDAKATLALANSEEALANASINLDFSAAIAVNIVSWSQPITATVRARTIRFSHNSDWSAIKLYGRLLLDQPVNSPNPEIPLIATTDIYIPNWTGGDISITGNMAYAVPITTGSGYSLESGWTDIQIAESGQISLLINLAYYTRHLTLPGNSPVRYTLASYLSPAIYILKDFGD